MGDKIKFSTGTVVDVDGYLHQVGVKVNSTAAELNALDGNTATAAELTAAADNSAQAAKVAAAAGFSGTNTLVQTSVVRTGNIIKTVIAIDLTDAKSSTTDLDIIGNSGVSYIGQITTAVNGVVYAGQVGCGEVPTTGADDIDLYSATEATGEFDGGIAALAETALMTAGGAHAIGTVKPLTALPAADEYLYLVGGEAGTAGTYDAGRLFIELWGTVA